MCINFVAKVSAFRQPYRMICGYARVSTDGQSVVAQVKALRAAGSEKVFRETASGANWRRRLRRLAKKHRRIRARLDTRAN